MAYPTGGRPFDCLYDQSYTVSGARDHYREQTKAGAYEIKRVGDYGNFFSVLPHKPAYGYSFANTSKVPDHIDRQFNGGDVSVLEKTQQSVPASIEGTNRFKHFERPLYNPGHAFPVVTARVPVQNDEQIAQSSRRSVSDAGDVVQRGPGGAVSRTVGIQSDYRESEAQTLPWDPDFVLPEQPNLKQTRLSERNKCEGPEILSLRDMKFGDGLPPGAQEVARVEKLRAKRAFEARLPPIDDLERLPQRLKMIQEWEMKEWEEREAEIQEVQDQRLQLLDAAISTREAEIEEENNARAEALSKARLDDKKDKFAFLQRSRIKTMRHFFEARKYAEKPRALHKPTIVAKYGNFGSSVYAPMQRDGRFPDSRPAGQQIETEQFAPASYAGVCALEAGLSPGLLASRIVAPCKPGASGVKMNHRQRDAAALSRQLDSIAATLEESKALGGRGFGECWPAPVASMPALSGMEPQEGAHGVTVPGSPGAASSKGVGAAQSVTSRKPHAEALDRPPTPHAPLPAPDDAAAEAAVLLQRLLRGRAIQNDMYEGAVRRAALVAELRQEETSRRMEPRPESRDSLLATADALLGRRLHRFLRALVVSDPARIQRELSSLRGEKRSVDVELLTEVATHAASLMSAQATAPRGMRPRDARATTPKSPAAALATALEGTIPRVPDPTPEEVAAAARVAEQEMVRAALALEWEDEDVARVVLIQAGVRGWHARQRVANIRKGLPDIAGFSEEDKANVVKIQAGIRGHLARKRVGHIGAPSKAQPAAAAEGEDLPDMGDFNEKQKAVMATGIRGHLARKAAKEKAKLEAAEKKAKESLPDLANFSQEDQEKIIKMQAASRGYLARKRAAGMKAQAEEKSREEDLPDLESFSLEDQAKIIKLQAAGRGYLARKAAKAKGEPLQEPLDLSEFSTEDEEKIIKLQAAGRGYLARKAQRAKMEGLRSGAAAADVDDDDELPDLDSFSPEDQAKIIRLQAASRGYLARKAAKNATHAENPDAVDGEGADELPDLSSYSAEDEAAIIKMQAASRGYLARKAAKTRTEGGAETSGAAEEELPDLSTFSEEDQAKIVKMQAAGRGYLARKTAKAKLQGERAGIAAAEMAEENSDLPDLDSFSPEDQAKIIKLQAASRGYLARKAANQGVEATPSPGPDDELPDLSTFSEEDQAKIVKLQAASRGYLARKAAKAKGEIGLADDGLPDLSSYDEKDRAKIVRLQAAGRGYLARKAAKEKADQQTKEKAHNSLPDLEGYSEEEKAKIVKLQAAGRGYVARKRAGALRKERGVAASRQMPDNLKDLETYGEEERKRIMKIQAAARGRAARREAAAMREEQRRRAAAAANAHSTNTR